jgi:hypothetical protein
MVKLYLRHYTSRDLRREATNRESETPRPDSVGATCIAGRTLRELPALLPNAASQGR